MLSEFERVERIESLIMKKAQILLKRYWANLHQV